MPLDEVGDYHACMHLFDVLENEETGVSGYYSVV
jgi:hypothetical protein